MTTDTYKRKWRIFLLKLHAWLLKLAVSFEPVGTPEHIGLKKRYDQVYGEYFRAALKDREIYLEQSRRDA